MAFHRYRSKVQTLLADSLSGPETLSEAVQNYVNKNGTLLDVHSIVEVSLFTLKALFNNVFTLKSTGQDRSWTGDYAACGRCHLAHAAWFAHVPYLLQSHVKKVCSSAMSALRQIGKIRGYLDETNTKRLIHSLVTSRLDSCNTLLKELPSSEIDKIQRIQNTAARIVEGSSHRSPIAPLLQKLHWLPIEKRIKFKIILLTFKLLSGSAPSYLTDLIQFMFRPAPLVQKTSIYQRCQPVRFYRISYDKQSKIR